MTKKKDTKSVLDSSNRLLNPIKRLPKGQSISKCLFGVFNLPKKQTKTIQLEVCTIVVKLIFHSFVGRIKDTKMTF